MSIISSYIVPHPPMILKEIGKGNEKQIKTTSDSYEIVAKEIKEANPETIIIISPHTNLYMDGFYIMPNKQIYGNFGFFNASDISFEEENDILLAEKIKEICNRKKVKCISQDETLLDHGTMVPLYFIRKYFQCKIVVIGLSELSLYDHYKFGTIIKSAVEEINRKVIIVASGDLSHKLQEYGPYGYIKEGPIYDEKICSIMKNTNFNEFIEFDKEILSKAAECGHRSFTIMSGTFDGIDVKSIFLSHEDITGVGYAVCKFYPLAENINRKFGESYLNKIKKELKERYMINDSYINLARQTINSYIKENKIIDIPENIESELLDRKTGVFVSIYKFGRLRGCIGTFIPREDSIACEIRTNAIAAATQDHRFEKIDSDELDYLEINVDVLTTPEEISSLDELDPKKYGVIVTSGLKKGLLLPDLYGVDTVDQQINIALSKGNINKGENYEIFRFEVDRHKI